MKVTKVTRTSNKEMAMDQRESDRFKKQAAAQGELTECGD